jgi:hypothetical protein
MKKPFYRTSPAFISVTPGQQRAYAHLTSGKVRPDAPIYFNGEDEGWVVGIVSHHGPFVVLEIHIHGSFTNVIFNGADVDMPFLVRLSHLRKWATGPKVTLSYETE